MKVNILREIPVWGGNVFKPLHYGDMVFRMEGKLAAGHKTPPHYHKYFDEHWTVVKGEPTFIVGKEKHKRGPGETFSAPRNIVHALMNETIEDIVLITEMRPAADMAQMMAIMAGLQDEREKAWMFKYMYVERRSGMREFSTPAGAKMKIIMGIMMPLVMLTGKLKGWDKYLGRYEPAQI